MNPSELPAPSKRAAVDSFLNSAAAEPVRAFPAFTAASFGDGAIDCDERLPAIVTVDKRSQIDVAEV